MAQIVIKKDSNIKKPEIVIPLIQSSENEMGENYLKNQQGVRQSAVRGILAPIIQINNIFIDLNNIISFSLKSVGRMPTITAVVRDENKLVSTLDTPGADNTLQVQILPEFDGVYKKINLLFYITDLKISNGFIHLSGVYKEQKFLSSNIKSFGEISTYKLFEEISKDTDLGFASNLESNEQDKRYIYCDYKNYRDILDREISSGGSEQQVLDYWVDFWDNLTLIDIRERYTTIDPDEELALWVADRKENVLEGQVTKGVKVPGVISNQPAMKTQDTYVQSYKIVNKTAGQIFSGSDKVYSTYQEDLGEYVDYLVQDGDVKKDIYTKFEYMGEVYGNYNYLLASRKRGAFLQKMNSETIEVSLRTPVFGLVRGHRINFIWYTNDSYLDYQIKSLKEDQRINEDIRTNVPLDSTGTYKESPDGKFTIDKSISGQYLIIGTNIKYENNQWEYIVTLTRPAQDKPNIMKEHNE